MKIPVTGQLDKDSVFTVHTLGSIVCLLTSSCSDHVDEVNDLLSFGCEDRSGGGWGSELNITQDLVFNIKSTHKANVLFAHKQTPPKNKSYIFAKGGHREINTGTCSSFGLDDDQS